MKILGLGMPELIIILVVILIIFGPKNLPKLGSALGRTVKNVREGVEGKGVLEAVEVQDDEAEEVDVEEAPAKTSAKKKAAAGK